MTARNQLLARARRIVLQRLESLSRSGVAQISKSRWMPPPARTQVVAPAPAPADIKPAKEAFIQPERDIVPNRGPHQEVAHQLSPLDVMRQEVAACRRCQELARTRTQTVFGTGDPSARLCFMGEAPGADEDKRGEPFVGRAGQLLTDILQKGMGLQRDDVYILNVLKCRPPNNRTPEVDEVANCREYFQRQLAAIRPEFICCLGSVASQALLQTNLSLGRLRGRFHEYQGAKVLVTYHPSFLLRFPEMKKETWQDIQMLMHEMGIAAPKK